MKNIEKYEERIEELEYKFALCGDELKRCKSIRCDNCNFYKLDGKPCNLHKIKWLLEEYKEPILDDKEKEYLSAVIKPFKNRVKSINKVVYHNDLAFIRLTFDENDHVYFPHFRLKSGMYKGMKNNKDYTLEELGL